ncbi:MAG: ABC transporter substrate-binding protein [Alphaproteobacteria bacterium]
MVFSLIAGTLLLAAMVVPAVSSAAPDAKTIEAAKKERTVAYYTGLNVNAVQRLIDAFEKRYPFLKVEPSRYGHVQVRTRIFTEAAAGSHRFDIASIPSIDLQTIKKKGLLASYRSPELDGIPKGLKDEDGYWAAMYITQFIIGYNIRMINKSDVPRDWDDLLRGQWKTRIGMDPDAPLWYASLLEYWGREKATRFMKALAAQQPHLSRGYTLLAQMMAAGEFPLAIVHAHKVEDMKNKGAPIDWVRTVDPVVTSAHALAIAAHAPHPNAARLLEDFILSKEGQLTLHQSFLVPVRTDIPPLTPALDQSKLKVFPVHAELADEYEKYERQYHNFLGVK